MIGFLAVAGVLCFVAVIALAVRQDRKRPRRADGGSDGGFDSGDGSGGDCDSGGGGDGGCGGD